VWVAGKTVIPLTYASMSALNMSFTIKRYVYLRLFHTLHYVNRMMYSVHCWQEIAFLYVQDLLFCL